MESSKMRHSLGLLLASFALLSVPNCTSPEPLGPVDRASDDRPNIIVILVDDQRFDAFGSLNPNLAPPALDRLLEEGVRFENAFVTT